MDIKRIENEALEFYCENCATELKSTVGKISQNSNLICPDCRCINPIDLEDILNRSRLLAEKVYQLHPEVFRKENH